jgi:multiple sugar transport system ATP-binding protein
MNDLVFSKLEKVYGNGVTAVSDFSLEIPDPSLAVIVGPSGCGKTTVLRLISGLEKPTRGEIHLGGARLDTVEPKDRDVAMVFQSYALFPHMTVRGNLSFGLRLRKQAKSEIEKKVQEVSKTLEIDGLLDRKPGQLSGGQRQRVALGRAIIREPRVFLFDEPLSNLDARLRVEMRYTIKKLFKRLQTTSLYVTHDQVEAMTIGETLIVMNEGSIQQVGTPETCYQSPVNTFVASFLGSPPMKFLKGKHVAEDRTIHIGELIRLPLSGQTSTQLTEARTAHLQIGIRPEHVRPFRPGIDPPDRAIRGRIVLVEPLGHETLTYIAIGGDQIVARGREPFTEEGDDGTSLWLDSDELHFFASSGERIETPSGRG